MHSIIPIHLVNTVIIDLLNGEKTTELYYTRIANTHFANFEAFTRLNGIVCVEQEKNDAVGKLHLAFCAVVLSLTHKSSTIPLNLSSSTGWPHFLPHANPLWHERVFIHCHLSPIIRHFEHSLCNCFANVL